MDLASSFAVMLVILASGALLYWLKRRERPGQKPGLRPIAGYSAFRGQVGRAVESGRYLHFALGRGDLASQANPASLAALSALDYLAKDACSSGVPPLVAVGDGTLLVAGQDSLRGAYERADRGDDYAPSSVEFLAAQALPMTYAAGVSDIINRENLGSNLMLGRFGAELAIMAEAAEREDMEQVIGSDDPVAVALAMAVTEKVLIGEELLAAGAYLEGSQTQIASLRMQDILRIAAAAGVLLAALYRLVVG